MSIKQFVIVICILGLLIVAGCNMPLASGGECGPTNCLRTIGWSPIDMPEGQVRDLNRMLDAAFFSGLLTSAIHSSCPTVEFQDVELKQLNMEWVNKMLEKYGDIPAPEQVEQTAVLSEFDYIFVGSLSANANGFDVETGDLLGQFTLHVQLIDQHHGETVQDGLASWSFTEDGIAGSRDMLQAVKSLGESFVPIDGILCDYERLPESAKAELDKEKVGVGEEIAIQLTDIFDYNNRQPQSWWRVFVKVDKGEIKNGDKVDEYSVFRVEGGTIDVDYRAPELCPGEDKSETIWVYNTCAMTENSSGDPDTEIVKKEFEILCDIELEISFWQVADAEGMHDEQGYTGRIPFSVNYKDDPPSLQGEGDLAIAGNGEAGDCQWVHQGVIHVTLSGYLENAGSREPRLYITEEMVSKSHTIEGNIEGCTGGQLFPITLSPNEYDFPVEDGHKIEWDFDMMIVKGKASRILHVP